MVKIHRLKGKHAHYVRTTKPSTISTNRQLFTLDWFSSRSKSIAWKIFQLVNLPTLLVLLSPFFAVAVALEKSTARMGKTKNDRSSVETGKNERPKKNCKWMKKRKQRKKWWTIKGEQAKEEKRPETDETHNTCSKNGVHSSIELRHRAIWFWSSAHNNTDNVEMKNMFSWISRFRCLY